MTRNRVTPAGEIVEIAQRGAFLGNRGRLTRAGELVRPWDGRRWITCQLSYKGWQAPAFGTDGRWTPLFFLDEAVALAAGHRPCALCRRPDYERFGAAWTAAFGAARPPSAEAVDRRLHADRLDGGRQRVHRRPWRSLPDATFVALDGGAPARVAGDRLLPWSPSSAVGYDEPVPRPRRGDADVLTPACTVEVLAAGYDVAPVRPRAVPAG